MLFRPGRCFPRGILFCLLLIGGILLLKQRHPEIGAQIGQWISGAKESAVYQAISSMLSTLSDGGDMKTAVEVLCENLQIS